MHCHHSNVGNMLISLYICSFLLLTYVGHCFAMIELNIDEDQVDKLRKNPLCFSGFRGCGGAKLRLGMNSLVMEIKKCGNVASSKLDKTYVTSHMKFLWGQENPLSSDEPGKIEGAAHKIDGKAELDELVIIACRNDSVLKLKNIGVTGHIREIISKNTERNTMEVQFYFYDNKIFEGIEHASWSNGIKVVSVFLQTDTRLIDNPRFSRIMKYLLKVSRFNQAVPIRSGKWVPKFLRKKTEKRDSGAPRKMSALFDAFYGVFNTADKRVLHYKRQKLKMGDREIKTEVFVIEEAIPVSPEQVYAFWKLIPDFSAPHVSESVDEEFEAEVFTGPKY